MDTALLKSLPPEVTTGMLVAALQFSYKNPAKKIHDLVRSRRLLSIKQGVYILNPDLDSRSYSLSVLANLIYGPSYVSLETALSHYGFIPEQVASTTSVCLGRNKRFQSPVGVFEYSRVDSKLYPFGIQLKPEEGGRSSLYATPEKALLDFIYLKEKAGEFRTASKYFSYLVDGYRFDLETIHKTISLRKLSEWSEFYRLQRIHWFVDGLSRWGAT